MSFETSSSSTPSLVSPMKKMPYYCCTRRPKILLMGDSLTQTSFEGWGATLSHVYQSRADVINYGCSGYNTRYYLKLPFPDEYKATTVAACSSIAATETTITAQSTADETNKQSHVCLVLLFFGANDAALPKIDDHHHVPVIEYAANLKLLIQRVQHDFMVPRIMLLSPPPVHHEQRLQHQKHRYGDHATGIVERTLEHTGLYAAACRQVAVGMQLPCLDLYHDMQRDNDWGRFLSDGLHFSSQGHDYVGQAVVKAIATHFPDLEVKPDPRTGQWCSSASTCNGLQCWGPHHDRIDRDNPKIAFEQCFSKKE